MCVFVFLMFDAAAAVEEEEGECTLCDYIIHASVTDFYG